MTIIHGDCLAAMAEMAPNSADSIVTDPPYGLSFMGLEWDHGVPGELFWREALRVAAPGAFMVAFGGTRTHHRLACAIEDAGWELRDCLMWLYGQGFPKSDGVLKPGWEPILLARKRAPAPKLQIDLCRIPVADQKGGPSYAQGSSRIVGRAHGEGIGFAVAAGDPNVGKGRWPANVILDEDAATFLDQQSGVLTSGFSAGFSGEYKAEVFGKYARNEIRPETIYADTGGASRFFYCAKASRSERTHNGVIENNHPTVKPVTLMRWLTRLITPPNGHVLDPFCGSGSTGVACAYEGFPFTGIDKDFASAVTAGERVKLAIGGSRG
jgi:site-specific DNA-methyltransferase (adenine-specific)